MQKLLGIILLFCTYFLAPAQLDYPYQQHFQTAYQNHSDIPKGMLEAVAYTNTHIRHIQPDLGSESCMGLPSYYGVMGLVLDGKNYFRSSLLKVSSYSNIPVEDIIQSPEKNILGYAKAFAEIKIQKGITSNNPADLIPVILELSELPLDTALPNDFAINSQLYAIFSFLDDPVNQRKYFFPNYPLDMKAIFGKDNLEVLSSPGVTIAPNSIQSNTGIQYHRRRQSTDYSPAIWDPTSCNFSSRNGTAITAVTVHTTQGSYAGTISWFKNCNSFVSAHYVIRSSDGQVTQMVAESDKAWHVGSENAYTIGIEHEGFVNDSSWYTAAMYNSSADLVKDITNSGYGINPLSTYKGHLQTVLNSCYRIKGHVHFPNQTHTDPGEFWDWQYYYDRINDTILEVSLTDCAGNFIDHGGVNSNYSDFEKYVTIIQPPNANSITLTFTSFSLELDYDYLHIYDGDDLNAPLIGSFTGTNSPGTIVSSTGSLALLFESDCSINDLGWEAEWTCNNCGTITTEILSSDVSCHNADDGVAAISSSGGAAPYIYQWSNGGHNFLQDDLSGGWHSVTITDSFGCTTVDSVFIDEPDPLVFEGTSVIESNNLYNISIDSLTGGTPPYSFLWSTGSTNATVDNLSGGLYFLTVTDANSCSIDTFFLMDDPTSVDQVSDNLIHIYPNPVEDILFVDVKTIESKNLRVIIYSQMGQKVVEQALSGQGISQLNLSGLVKGVYLVRIICNSFSKTDKLFLL